MPRDVNRVRPERRLIGKQDLLSVVLAQQFLLGAGFREFAFRDDYLVVVGERPEAVVEEPVGILEGDAVAWVVAARVRELVDVGRIADALACDGGGPGKAQ